ncbi:AtpZ/AtpI family protein [Algihabitans albus]|uniref:AtpZ/AtpI family protein n=1 Tax=Algihabitans albus TaxID=2164067 RepID=UPI0013C3629A|nr:AtpZ/AtpI family protein [Algihabitans albus]
MATEPGSRGPSPSDDGFDERLKAARKRREAEKSKWKRVETQGPSGLGIGMRIASEIVAAILVSVAIGLMLDRFLGTKPWMLILFIVLGSGAAISNVIRTGRELDRKQKEAKARAAEQAQQESAAESEGRDERRD